MPIPITLFRSVRFKKPCVICFNRSGNYIRVGLAKHIGGKYYRVKVDDREFDVEARQTFDFYGAKTIVIDDSLFPSLTLEQLTLSRLLNKPRIFNYVVTAVKQIVKQETGEDIEIKTIDDLRNALTKYPFLCDVKLPIPGNPSINLNVLGQTNPSIYTLGAIWMLSKAELLSQILGVLQLERQRVQPSRINWGKVILISGVALIFFLIIMSVLPTFTGGGTPPGQGVVP